MKERLILFSAPVIAVVVGCESRKGGAAGTTANTADAMGRDDCLCSLSRASKTIIAKRTSARRTGGDTSTRTDTAGAEEKGDTARFPIASQTIIAEPIPASQGTAATKESP